MKDKKGKELPDSYFDDQELEVTNENFGDILIASVEQALDHVNGKITLKSERLEPTEKINTVYGVFVVHDSGDYLDSLYKTRELAEIKCAKLMDDSDDLFYNAEVIDLKVY